MKKMVHKSGKKMINKRLGKGMVKRKVVPKINHKKKYTV